MLHKSTVLIIQSVIYDPGVLSKNPSIELTEQIKAHDGFVHKFEVNKTIKKIKPHYHFNMRLLGILSFYRALANT
jgi:hypothetical protein